VPQPKEPEQLLEELAAKKWLPVWWESKGWVNLPRPSMCFTPEQLYETLGAFRRQDDWRRLSVTAIAAENRSVAEYVEQLENQLAAFRTGTGKPE
jgi:hypothetical protein